MYASLHPVYIRIYDCLVLFHYLNVELLLVLFPFFLYVRWYRFCLIFPKWSENHWILMVPFFFFLVFSILNGIAVPPDNIIYYQLPSDIRDLHRLRIIPFCLFVSLRLALQLYIRFAYGTIGPTGRLSSAPAPRLYT